MKGGASVSSHTLILYRGQDFNGIPGLNLRLRHPIFFCASARLAKGQHKAQPVLFMAGTDWHYLRQPQVTHRGAFDLMMKLVCRLVRAAVRS